jgi:hypothetical protein
MTYNNDWKPTENNIPNIFQPTPQTPEQVDEGLRNAFRQAMKDGVMDATPYLKQMTYKSDIEKTEAEIKVLQKKLDLLKEIETHKSQLRMEFDFGGKFEFVSYNDEEYLRLQFNDESHNWFKKKHTVDGMMLAVIMDGETRRLLEGVWFNEVKKGKYDDVVDEPDEVEWDEKDNPKSKTIRDVIDRWWMDTFTSKNMWSVNECIDDLADQIELWILRNKK